MSPPHSVPSQLNVLMAEGTAMTIVVTMKAVPSAGFMPLRNMWWPQTIQDEEGDGDHRERHGVVAEDRLAREHRQDVGGDAHGGQDQDVDLGVAEEPEQVLPEQRLAAARRDEEAGAERAVEEQHGHGRRSSTGRASSSRMAVMNSDQTVSGMRKQRHARRPHVDDRRDVVDRAHHGRDAEDEQADAPEVLAPVHAGVGRARPRAAYRTSSPPRRARPARRSRTA